VEKPATKFSRRSVVASAAAAGIVVPRSPLTALAQDSTPVAGAEGQPGVALARVRKLPTAELNEAIYPDVMRTFLPKTAAVPGFAGYVMAFHADDPTASITLTLVSDDAAAEAAGEVARAYVGQLDPRFVVETPLSLQGRARFVLMTDRPPTELPPFLHGCVITMRKRVSAPGVNVEDLVAMAEGELAPILQAMPGFILYSWIQTEDGRMPINIWETEEDLRAGDKAVADYVAANTASTSVGDAVVNEGPIGYAEIVGLTL
jgi:hypothetical protein